MTTARPVVPPPAPDAEQGSPDVRISRRRWVRDAVIGGTVVAAGAGLAACSSSSPRASGPASATTGGATPGTTSSSGGGAPTAPAATTGATPTDDKGGGSGGGDDDTTQEQFRSIHLGRTSSIPVGGGVVYRTQGVVVTQPTAGTFKCFSASCTHLGCLVNKVAAGLIECPCHGARFSIVDGSVKAGPAPRPLTQQGFSVQNGVIDLD